MKRYTNDWILNGSKVSIKLTNGSVQTGQVNFVDNLGISLVERVQYEISEDDLYQPQRREMRLYPWNAIENVRYGFIWDKKTGPNRTNDVTDVGNMPFMGGHYSER